MVYSKYELFIRRVWQMKRRIIAVLLLVCMLFAFSAEAFAATVKVKSLKITNGNVDILVGDTITLKTTITPSNASNKGVTWSTSDKAIATVSSTGVVKGIKKGTVTITAVSKDNKKIKATCKITVKEIEVKSVAFAGNSVEVIVGKTVTIPATVSPSNATNKKVTYSSSNAKIAKVDSKGVVTGVKKGTCTITAKSSNGKTAKTTVKVVPIPKVASVKIDQPEIYMDGPEVVLLMFGKKVQLKATCSPAGADQKVTWSSSNNKVATVSEKGVVTPKGHGTCIITAKSSNGKIATRKVLVKPDIPVHQYIEVFNFGPYKEIDFITFHIDGLTGEINKETVDCVQHPTDLSAKVDAFFEYEIVDKDVKAYNIQKDYVDFRSTYSVKAKVGTKIHTEGGEIEVAAGGTIMTGSVYYRVDKQGNVKKLRDDITTWFRTH